MCIRVCLWSWVSGGLVSPRGVRDHACASVALPCVHLDGLGPHGATYGVFYVYLSSWAPAGGSPTWSVGVHLRVPPCDMDPSHVDVPPVCPGVWTHLRVAKLVYPSHQPQRRACWGDPLPW